MRTLQYIACSICSYQCDKYTSLDMWVRAGVLVVEKDQKGIGPALQGEASLKETIYIYIFIYIPDSLISVCPSKKGLD